MRNILFTTLIIITISACDFYDSKHPITEKPMAEVPENLLGEWVLSSTNDDGYKLPIGEIQVLDWGDSEALILWRLYSDYGEEMPQPVPIKAWISKVNAKEYVNIRMLGNEENIYNFYKYNNEKPDRLEVDYLEGTLKLQFDSSTSLYNYIAENQEEFESYFSNEWATYKRWESLTWSVVNGTHAERVNGVIVIDEKMSISEFEATPATELAAIGEEVIEGTAYFLSELNTYHLTRTQHIRWRNPQKYLIRKNNGEYVKFMSENNVMLDVDNNFLYKKIDVDILF